MEEEDKLIFEYLVNGSEFIKKVLCVKDKEGNLVDLNEVLSEIKNSINKSFPKAGDSSHSSTISPLFFLSSAAARMLSPDNSGSITDIINIMFGITFAAKMEEKSYELVVLPDRKITLDDIPELEHRAIARLNQFDSNLARIMDHALTSVSHELSEPISLIRKTLMAQKEARAGDD